MKAWPGVRGGLVELEAVVKEANKYIEESKQNVSLYSVDLFSDTPLPKDYDLHFYCNIFHIFSDHQCNMMAKKSYEALPVNGKLVLCEVLMNDDETGPLEACLFNMQMFKVLPHGRQFTAKQVMDILVQAGFHSCKVEYLFAGYSLFFATK